MNLAIKILNKEIERREILLAVENNVLIQNDMSNEIGVLKDSVKNLALSGVVVPKGTLCECKINRLVGEPKCTYHLKMMEDCEF